MMILRFIYGPQVEVVPSRSFAQLQVHQDIPGQCQSIPEIRVEMVPGGQWAKVPELEERQGSARFHSTLVQGR